MILEIGLASFLKGHVSLAPLVVSGDYARIFPLLIPEKIRDDPNQMPCLVYQRIASSRSTTFCSTDTLANATIQIDSYALSYVRVKQVAKALLNALLDYTGTMGDARIDRVFADTEFDIIETDTGLFRVSQTYSIWYYEE